MCEYPKQDKEREKLFFSQFSSGYDIFTEAGYEKLLKVIQDEIGSAKNLRVLDLGCGSGAFTQYLLRLGGEVFASDICYDLIKRVSKPEKIRIVTADIESLPFADSSFDIVIFSGVLHHLPVLSMAIKEAYRVLKNNGRCFSYDPNGKNPIARLINKRRISSFLPVGRTLNERPLTHDIIKEAFQAEGFSSLNVFAVSGIPFKYNHSVFMRILLPIFNCIDHIFSKTSLSSKYGYFLLVVARKNRQGIETDVINNHSSL